MSECNHSPTVQLWALTNDNKCPVCLAARLAEAIECCTIKDIRNLAMSDIVERLRDVPDSKLSAYAADEIDRLEARLAEAERDAARYRWLQDCGGFDLPADDAIDAARATDSAMTMAEAVKCSHCGMTHGDYACCVDALQERARKR